MKALLALFAAFALAGASSFASAQEDCPPGTHWDEDVQDCVPDAIPDDA